MTAIETELPIALNLVIASRDRLEVRILEQLFRSIEGVVSIESVEAVEEILPPFDADRANALLVDIASLGAPGAVQAIATLRRTHRKVPVCLLLGSSTELATIPGIPDEWRARFGHYYRLYTNQPAAHLHEHVVRTAKKLSAHLLRYSAKVAIRDLRGKLHDDEPVAPARVQQKNEEIEQVLALADRAIAVQADVTPQPQYIGLGFDAAYVQRLVNETFDKASKALDTTAAVNKGILVFGAVLILISFAVASLTKRWEGVAFGGFGMAGIIATLITNPLTAISLGARRLVQVQMAYLGFLNQLSILNTVEKNAPPNSLERSHELTEATKSILELLEKHF